jgi:hypothetical protein
MMSPVVIILLIVVILMLVMGFSLYLLRRQITNRTQAAREKFPNARLIIPSANFYGQESKGVMQMRGNGTLVLTDTELYFDQWVLQREFRIPLASIQALETPSSYLGKTNFRPLLKVVFRDESGQSDSMGWLVPDVQALKRAIEAARG